QPRRAARAGHCRDAATGQAPADLAARHERLHGVRLPRRQCRRPGAGICASRTRGANHGRRILNMPFATARDGTRLHYEEAGKGLPLVFVHEFSGDSRSWEPQLRFFARRYRCIAFNARGYPPSDVPRAKSKYSWRIAVDDIADVLRHLSIRRAHVAGCSMGAYSALQFGLRYPSMALSVTSLAAGAG